MKKILLGLCLLSLILIVGCNVKDGPHPTNSIIKTPSVDDIACDKNTVGTKAKADCNTCTCIEEKGHYGWACTEIGCTVFS